jgi:hypothetical protein
LVFEGGDRAVLDARSLEELERLVEATAVAAAAARQYDSSRPRDEESPSISFRA